MGKNSQTALALLAHKKAAKRKAKKKTEQSASPSSVSEVKELTSRLTHSDPSFREKALVALINLNIDQNQKVAQALISPDVLQAVLGSLNDALQNIRLTGLSVIMGLLQTEYASKVAQFFLENGLLNLLHKMLVDIETQLNIFLENRAIKPVLDYISFIRSIAALLQNLIQEFEDKALDSIVTCEASQWIFKFFLSESQFLPDVAKSCAEYLYAVALQSNKISLVLESKIDLLEGRLSSAHQAFLETQAYIAGILYHYYQQQGLTEEKMEKVLGPFLGSVFERDCVSQFFLNIEPLVTKQEQKAKSKVKNEETAASSPAEEVKQQVEHQKVSQGVAKTWRTAIQANLVMFEILIDLAALPVGEQDEWEDEDPQQESKEQKKERTLPPQIAKMILNGYFLDKVYSKLEFKGLTQDLVYKLKENPGFHDKLYQPILALRTSAAQTLGNIMLFHEIPNMSQELGVMMWNRVFEIVMMAGEDNVLIVESLLRLIKALLENPSLRQYFQLHSIACESHLMFLINWLQGEETRGKIAAVGVLGSILSEKKHSLEENKKLWILLTGLCQSGDVELTCETLNAIFDIYGENEYDQVLKQTEALQALEAGRSGLIELINKGELTKGYSELEMSHFQETVVNLGRFIAYKREEMD